MNFDPMTGEPIKRKFDPMTGEPINQEPITETPAEPTAENPVEQTAVPETPVPETSSVETPVAEAPTPETTVNYTPGWQPQSNYDSVTDLPTGDAPKKKGKGAIIAAGIVAAVLLVAVVIFVVIKSGIFLSKADKVFSAVKNTFQEQGAMAEALDVRDIVESNKYTVSFGADIEGSTVDLDYRVNKSEYQIAGGVNIAGMADIDFMLGVEDDTIKAQIPYISDKVFIYNYAGKNSGYLTKMMDKEDLEEMDTLLKKIFDTDGNNKLSEELSEAFWKEYDALEIKDAEEETFEVDGKDRECKGYTLVISEESMENLLNAWEEICEENYQELEALITTTSGYGSGSISDAFDELRSELEGMPDIEITFYLYKNQLACIAMEAEGDEIQLQFLGGDRRTQNMRLIDAYGDTIFEVIGSTDGSVETTEMYVVEECVFTVCYDKKSGEYEIYTADDEFYMAGVIETNKKGVEISIDELSDGTGDVGFSGSVSVRSGADMEEFSDDVFDIGNATEEEWMDLSEELNDNLGAIY